MKVKVEAIKKEYVDIEVNTSDAFRILCQTLDMEWMLDDDLDFYAALDKETEECFVMKGGEVYDDRGELYLALCNLAREIFPNCELRNPTVVKREEE